jgi:hypothetical protein
MRESDATRQLRRLADAFGTLAPGIPGLTIDWNTGTRAGAVPGSGPHGLRIRLESGRGDTHVCLYLHQRGADLELLSSSAFPSGVDTWLDVRVGIAVMHDYRWRAVRGREESELATVLLSDMRRRLLALDEARP